MNRIAVAKELVAVAKELQAIDDDEKAIRGQQLAKAFDVRKSGGRYSLPSPWGTKTDIGVYEVAKRIVEGGYNG